jgi:ribosome-binding protein aMBF1 (putative translation factor)
MRSKTELSATISGAMQEKGIDKNDLAKLLGISSVMVEKLLCGDVVPSRHLEKVLVDTLGIPEQRVKKMSVRRERQDKAGLAREARTKKSA